MTESIDWDERKSEILVAACPVCNAGIRREIPIPSSVSDGSDVYVRRYLDEWMSTHMEIEHGLISIPAHRALLNETGREAARQGVQEGQRMLKESIRSVMREELSSILNPRAYGEDDDD